MKYFYTYTSTSNQWKYGRSWIINDFKELKYNDPIVTNFTLYWLITFMNTYNWQYKIYDSFKELLSDQFSKLL